MPDLKKCERCDGKGWLIVLVSQHDDKKESVRCDACNGKGVISMMIEREEEDYRANNDW